MPVWTNIGTDGYYYTTTSTTSNTTGIVFNNYTVSNSVMITNCTAYSTRRYDNAIWDNWDPQPIHQPVRSTVRPTPIHTIEGTRKATELLNEHLTEEQRKTLKERHWFIVQGGRTGKPYRIERGRGLIANVAVLKDDRVEHRLCAHLGSDIPEDDHLLAQKLWLEHAEDEFVKRANRHAAVE
jgi:hypothetical protein